MSQACDGNDLNDWEVSVDESSDSSGSILRKIVATSISCPDQRHEFQTAAVHGISYPSACGSIRWDKLNQKVTYKPGDILIVSFPKCGTTWSEQAVLLLLNGGDPTVLDPRFKNSYTTENKSQKGKIWIEAMVEQDPQVQLRMGSEGSPLSWEEFDAAPSPRVIKTHAPVSLLLGSKGLGLDGIPDFVKVVIVTRNALDACVSSYYHAFNPFKCGWPFAAWAAVWAKGLCAHGGYFAWVKDWYEQHVRHPNQTLWIEYESMKKDPVGELSRLSTFLQIDANEEMLRDVQRFSSFEHMKEQTEKSGGDSLHHMRKGVVGDWKLHFNKEIYDQFHQLHAESIGSLGILPFPKWE